MTTGTRQPRHLLRAGAAVLAFALVCYSPQAPSRPKNLELVQILPSADVALPAMSRILGGDEQARRTLQSARLVYRHFIYDAIGHPREAIPVQLASLFESNIGQCDAAAHLFAKVRTADGDARFGQFDLITVIDKATRGQSRPTRVLDGHSIAAMEGPNGSIAVDPTFGLLLVSPAPKLTAEVLHRRDYRLYRLWDTAPERNGIWPGLGIAVLRHMTNPDSDAAFAGAPLRAVSAAIALNDETTLIGTVDDSSADIAGKFGTWLDHLGWYFTPGSHVWNFEAREAGDYRLQFRFAPGVPNTFARDDLLPRVRIETTGTATLVAPEQAEAILLEGDGLELRLHVTPGKFGIVISTGDPGARKIDAIVVHREAGLAAPGDDAPSPQAGKTAGPT